MHKCKNNVKKNSSYDWENRMFFIFIPTSTRDA